MDLGHHVLLLDVSPQDEFENRHITGSIMHPLEYLDPENTIQKIRIAYPNLPTVYITGDSNARCAEAYQGFEAAGYEYIKIVEGGTQTWEEAGLPTESLKEILPFEKMNISQQIQIIVGSIVTLGTLMGTFVNTGFLAISLLAGVGVVYEGLFGTDYLKQMVLKMAWNKEA
jgi:rhodanese-related sulfurtransferase